MRDLIRADLRRYVDPGAGHADVAGLPDVATVLFTQGLWAGVDYRWRQWARRQPGFRGSILRKLGLLTGLIVETVTGISISNEAQFGPGLYIGHFGAIVVGPGVRAGEDCNLSQGVTLGLAGQGERRGSPTLGDRVYVGPGAKAYGPITIGDDVRIGANAVVPFDVPSGTTLAAPAAQPVGAQPVDARSVSA